MGSGPLKIVSLPAGLVILLHYRYSGLERCVLAVDPVQEVPNSRMFVWELVVDMQAASLHGHKRRPVLRNEKTKSVR